MYCLELLFTGVKPERTEQQEKAIAKFEKAEIDLLKSLKNDQTNQH